MRDDHLHQSAEELRERAKQCRERSRESFERCDTDGFLSQWASDINARLYDEQAAIADNNGEAEFTGLFDKTSGRRVRAKLITSRFGMCWMMFDKNDKPTGEFFPFRSKGKQSRKQEKAGLFQKHEMAPAYACITTPKGAKSTGLGGCANAYVAVIRKDKGYPEDAIEFRYID